MSRLSYLSAQNMCFSYVHVTTEPLVFLYQDSPSERPYFTVTD